MQDEKRRRYLPQTQYSGISYIILPFCRILGMLRMPNVARVSLCTMRALLLVKNRVNYLQVTCSYGGAFMSTLFLYLMKIYSVTSKITIC